jgi:CubicO group peptidase (beta-lactamase class C family)
MATLLAGQPPEEDPRAADAYHLFTFGWLCGELVRRVDGRSVGRFFAEEVAAPLDLDVWIGLPAEMEPRVATLQYAPSWGQRIRSDAQAPAHDELYDRTWNNPPLFPPGELPWNRPDLHQAEIPAIGAIGTPRSLARLYGCLARGGELDGVRLLAADTLTRGREPLAVRLEPLLDEPQAFGTGFALQTEPRPFGPPSDAFGHRGAGGSVHCAWPSQGIGLSYAMNSLSDDEPVDPRADALLTALFEAAAQ